MIDEIGEDEFAGLEEAAKIVLKKPRFSWDLNNKIQN